MSKARKVNSYGELYPDSYEGYQGLIYARVSSKRQEKEGHGLDSQVGRCKNDLLSICVELQETFRDSFTGGGDFMKRPAMKRLLDYIDAKPHIKFVVVFDDLSRLARDVEAHIALMQAFKMRNVALRCLNYTFNDSPEGKYAELIMAGSAELHRAQNKRQVIQKQGDRLQKGYWAFGSKRGYRMVKHTVHGNISVPIEPEAGFLKEAIEGFADGRFVHKVDACRFLVEKGFWTSQKPERYIDKFTSILKDPFYAGYIEYLMWDIAIREGRHEGIISMKTFELVQKRLKKENNNKRLRLDVSSDFPLRGMIVCRGCDRHMTGAWTQGRTKRYPYYFCQNSECDLRGKVCAKKDVETGFDTLLRGSVLKSEISDVLETIFSNVWKKELSHAKGFEEASNRNKKIKEDELKELVSLMGRAKKQSVINVCERQIEELSDEIELLSGDSLEESDLDIPYQTALEKAQLLLKSPYKVWHSVDVVEKQRLFSFIFDEKLAYSKKAGYRTDNLPCAVRVFEEFVTTNSHDVEMARIEPASESGCDCESTVRS